MILSIFLFCVFFICQFNHYTKNLHSSFSKILFKRNAEPFSKYNHIFSYLAKSLIKFTHIIVQANMKINRIDTTFTLKCSMKISMCLLIRASTFKTICCNAYVYNTIDCTNALNNHFQSNRWFYVAQPTAIPNDICIATKPGCPPRDNPYSLKRKVSTINCFSSIYKCDSMEIDNSISTKNFEIFQITKLIPFDK